MTTPQAIIDTARGYLGVPFRHQGRSRRGLDCLGLLVCVARDLGMPEADNDMLNYGHSPDGGILKSALDAACDRVMVAAPGCVLLLSFTVAAGGQHVGIATDIGILHAYAPCRRVVEASIPPEWQSRIVARYRLRSVMYG